VIHGADWAWMMDDDAEPHENALETLLNRKLDTENIYASTAVSGDKLSWPMVPEGHAENCIYNANQVSEELRVDLVPFIGILVSKELVKKIGLPDEGLFLVADDIEYCLRARKSGAKVVLIGTSLINHPASDWYDISLFYRKLRVLRLAPWKRYYEVRNRFLLHKHDQRRLSPKNYIGWLLRLAATLYHEQDRYRQFRAYLGGLIDGTKGRKGKRHAEWKL
jgi:GT2 family glycosyltransferase